MVLSFAAHQGEELTLMLPAIMLVGAFFIFRWANQKPEGEQEAEAAEPAAGLRVSEQCDRVQRRAGAALHDKRQDHQHERVAVFFGAGRGEGF